MSNLVSNLVKESLRKTNAHGLARPVNEKQLYLRVLWLIVWLVMCGLFVRHLIGFISKLLANDVTTNIKGDYVQFEYPDLYFCYDNPMSGSRHRLLNNQSAAFISASFKNSLNWCNDLDDHLCEAITENDAAEVQMNSLPYKFLIDNMAHVYEQSVIISQIFRSNGLVYSMKSLRVTQFHHPTHLRCFKVTLNETDRMDLKFSGPDDSLYFLLMMDAPDLRMGYSELPVLQTGRGNLTAPYWALDKQSLSSRVRDSRILVFITQPGHYPSSFDSLMILEAGRTYSVQLAMKEQVHSEGPSRCVDKHPDVEMVNPYDNSPYKVKYSYAFCYSSAVQAQFKRELNATCPFLPHPWPPADRSLYNLSSGWGSQNDVENYLNGKLRLRTEEPLEKCVSKHPCTERIYTPSVQNVLWPSPDSIESELDGFSSILEDSHYPDAPALKHLRKLWANRGNASQPLIDYVRANFLQLVVTAKEPMVDQITFTRAYSFESFVADVGGILGIYLGMSLLTTFEVAQFLHDVAWILFRLSKKPKQNDMNQQDLSAISKF